MAKWSFLTNHARVLVCIQHDPGMRLREIGDSIGLTERAVHRIVDELVEAGYISRERTGRRNIYEIRSDLSLHDPFLRERKVSDLLTLLVAQHD